jgi:hypothetical protein
MQRLCEVIGRKRGERGLAGQRRRQPVHSGCRQRGVGEIGPLVAFRPAQEHHAVAPLA